MIITKKNRKTKGFTLVEIIIALSIVMIFVTVLSNVSYTALKLYSSSKKHLEAMVIAQNEIEKVRANPANLISLTSASSIYTINKTVTVKHTVLNYTLYDIVIEVKSTGMNPVILATRLNVKSP